MLALIQEGVLLIGTALGAVTDAKTGYIYDWITYPMILVGAILSITQHQWNNLIYAGIIFCGLYLLYKYGKLGGGDVKLYAAIALLNPVNDANFLLTAVFFAAMSAMIYYPVYYTIKYAKKGVKLEENNDGIKKALILGAIIVLYFLFLASTGLINPASIWIIAEPSR